MCYKKGLTLFCSSHTSKREGSGGRGSSCVIGVLWGFLLFVRFPGLLCTTKFFVVLFIRLAGIVQAGQSRTTTTFFFSSYIYDENTFFFFVFFLFRLQEGMKQM